MGIYINPPQGKEVFLFEYGEATSNLRPSGEPGAAPEHFRRWADGREWVAVCWLVSAGFTAIGVAYSENEFRAFQSPLDNRIKLWFWVPVEHLTYATCGANIAAILDEDGA